ncbi:hypothetical protein IGK74_001664 [Enterococcus sp. AZ150]|uniref:Membrane transport protein MMPL domain-containing protein n=1 Tax=Enterococcus sulfureus ATCC 49903 TaxID=1140003 RepID=S0KUW0_9ENTE|nr:MMPL family transporter [Enterococcus sulfureus]EOT48609.1 hypothetical protein OMY_00564 [Enterococcus sulfureus ATCC 49903]EOT87501.1 hypothetical protein I573_00557 [Enterococcus sulfureus ATCC 49903]
MLKKIGGNYRWSLILWLVLFGVALFTMPNTSKLVQEQGQVTLPSSMQSEVAKTLGEKFGNSTTDETIILVMHHQNLLSDTTQKIVKQKLQQLENKKEDYHIQAIRSVETNPDSSTQLISKNKQTELVLITLNNKETLDEDAKAIRQAMNDKAFDTYVTGSQLLTNEFSHTTETGIKKTEWIATIFILVVLILLFRSPIVPLLSLSTVALSFIIALNIVMNLAKYINFPISDFTQVFLVVVLFGIGTDYNILLYDKFKEELAKPQTHQAAAKKAQRFAGKTIVYSGVSVLIGFAVLSFAKFSFYQSAVGVAIGIAVLIPVLLTLNMFFMLTLGQKMFWPIRTLSAEKENKIWQKLSYFATLRPILILAILGIFGGVLYANTQQTLNYDTSDEIADSNPIKKGYVLIQEEFSKGMSAPTTLYLQIDNSLVTQENLATLDGVTELIKKNTGVKQVLSVTQPLGEKINALYLSQQLSDTTTGLEQSIEGMNKIKSGLNQIIEQLDSSTTDLSGVNQLATGSQTLAQSSSTFSENLAQYAASVNQVDENQAQLAQKMSQLNATIDQMAIQNPDTAVFQESLSQLTQQMTLLSNSLSSLNQAGAQLTAASNELTQATNQTAAGVEQVDAQLQQTATQTATLKESLQSMVSGSDEIISGLTKIQSYTKEVGESYVGNTFFIPKDQLDSKELTQSYDNFLSKNREVAQWTIILKDDPNSSKAVQTLDEIQNDVSVYLKQASLDNTTIALGGQTSQTADLKELSQTDFTRVAVIMLTGILIMLILVTKSIMQPVMIILTLILAYMGSLEVTVWISKLFFGASTLTWNTPFFSFIMLVSLGVDYSIFFIMRYQEERLERNPIPVNAIKKAAAAIGTVVLSAIIILSGTFAALIPSGIMTLIQVSITVIVGLLILFISLPLILSAYIKLTYKEE